MKKKSTPGIILFFVFSMLANTGYGQSQVYDDFEGANKAVYYKSKTGVLDTAAKNPAPDSVNNSEKCAMYVRNRAHKFDNIKMSFAGKLSDVSAYASYAAPAPKIKMKLYTDAPAGTLVEILLGSKGRNNEFPAGTHSQYQAYTTKNGGWEELEFKFSQVPMGSETSPVEIDQITLLFSPNSSTSYKYYFDEISGPGLLTADREERKPLVSEKKEQQIKK